jgi:thiol-disulfide isomerase/thioredoxin
MRRWFLAAALATAALGTTALVYSDDAKKPAKADSELAKAKAKYDADVKGKEDEIRKARTAEEADDLKKELREFKAIELDGLLDVAVKEPGTDIAFEIFSDLVFGGFDEMKSKIARAMIEKHHLEQPHVKKLILKFVEKQDNKADQILRVIAEKNTDADCRGLATFGLGVFAKNKMRAAGGEAKADEMKTAKGYFNKAKEKYGAVKVAEKTIAKLVDGELEMMALIGQLVEGKPVPDLSGEDLDGKAMKLSDHKGKVVMLSFWATWCPPCMALVPHEIELLEKNNKRPFALVGVNGDPELTDDVKDTIKAKKITWRSFKDTQGDATPISQKWELQGWPTIYLIDHKGIIKQKYIGSPGTKVLDEEIEKLVTEAEKK